MAGLTRIELLFVALNLTLGLAVAGLTLRLPAFAGLPVPPFGWLVIGVLLTDLALGALARRHPSALISMPARLVALVGSFLVFTLVTQRFA